MKSPSLYIEIAQNWLKLLEGDQGLELPLERQENGRLTPACAERLTLSLRGFLGQRSRQPALCAIGARGISLRRLNLPATSKEDIQKVLLFQIESEFPVPPDELAWGSRPLGSGSSARTASATREWLVVAVKKEALREYFDILSACGLAPVFTVAALARASLCPRPVGSWSMLDLGRHHSELVSFEHGDPVSVRVLPWGAEDLAGPEAPAALVRALSEVGQTLYLTGEPETAALASLLAKSGAISCQRIETPSGKGLSAAILGLKKASEDPSSPQPLILVSGAAKAQETLARAAHWKWAALAAALLVALLSLRYAEAIIQMPRVARRMAEIKAYRDKLPKVDRELSFLQYLKTNQPTYLNPIFVVANAAPPGTRLEALSLNRKGELSLRVGMQNSQQSVDFRSKLIDSGFFSNVVFDEQTPTPDHQKMTVRVTAQCKPSASWETLASQIPVVESKPGGGDPGMAFPGGMPPGAAMPGGPPPGARPSKRPKP